jgi:hypothetical protein
MWWKKKEQEKEEPVEVKKEEDLLKELCGDDVQLYGVLRNQLLLNPLTSVSEKDIDTLIEEAEKNGNFRQAMDKAIFEATQNPEEKERYTKVIQNLASKTIHATEQEKEKAEKEGLTDRVNSLEKWIEQQKILNDRTEDIISVASEFYSEKLLVGGEDERRAARALERQRIDREEWRLGEQAKAEREARKKEMKTMSKEERKEAEEREKREEMAAEERKAARAEEKRKAESEELSISEQEKREREARRDERQRNI